MSDLQCPTRFLLVGTDLLAGPRAAVIAQALEQQRPAAVYAPRSLFSLAESLAARLGVSAGAIDDDAGVSGFGASSSGFGSGGFGSGGFGSGGLPETMADALGEVADLHRGENVVVLLSGETQGVPVCELDSDGARALPSLLAPW